MNEEVLQRMIERTRRDADLQAVAGTAVGDQVDAFLRDHWHHVARIAVGGPDVRESLGHAVFDSVSRVLAMKALRDAFAASLDSARDDLRYYAGRASRGETT